MGVASGVRILRAHWEALVSGGKRAKIKKKI